MAPQRASAQKATEADKSAEEEKSAPDTGTEAKAAEVQATDEPETAEQLVPTDTAINKVAPLDGQEHGYIGQAHPDKNRDDYTVAGVTGGTAKTDDKPQDGENIRKAWAPLRS